MLDAADQGDAALTPAQAPQAPARPAGAVSRSQGRAQAFDDIDAPRAPPGSAGAGKTALHGKRVGQADDLGFVLTTGERLNADTLRQIEAGFRSSPFAPAHLREVKAANQVNLNNGRPRCGFRDGTGGCSP